MRNLRKTLRKALIATSVFLILHILKEYCDGAKFKILFSQKEEQRVFKILYWSRLRKKVNSFNWFGLGSHPFRKCEYKNCFLTDDKTEYNNSDAVLMKLQFTENFPSHRFPWQKWIARIHESPANGDYTIFDSLFNATWAYHSKSDVYSHHNMYRFMPMQHLEGKKDIQYHLKKKTKTAAWFVSHCKVPSKREEIVTALHRYIDIDIYGECGPLKCGAKMNESCDEMLGPTYKFYLSFENSLCDEYTTEKLWRAYFHDVIPVVMGASDYAAYLPEHSYIDIGKFTSIKHVADYLKILDKNDTLYLEYFNWKERYVIQRFGFQGCPLCKYLNQNVNETKVYRKLDQFWNKNTDCFSPYTYYRNLFHNMYEYKS